MRENIHFLTQFVSRDLKLYIKDRAGVFFSLMAPMIVLFLYLAFLSDVQVDAIKSAFQGVTMDDKLLQGFVDGWMLAGLLSVSCITVPFAAHSIMIYDRESGVLNDILVSPVKKPLIRIGYFIYNALVSVIICAIVLVVAFIYLAISGWHLSVADVFAIIGVMLLSILSASLLSTLICSWFKSNSAYGAFNGIMGSAIGFLVGAYMPLAMFPKGVQYFTLFLPGSYSAGAMRNLFTFGVLDRIGEVYPQAVDGLKDSYSMELDFFGAASLDAGVMVAILAGSVALIGILNIAVYAMNGEKSHFAKGKKRKKQGGLI